LEEGKVVAGYLRVIEVARFGDRVAIVPLPAGVVGDDGFSVGVDSFFPCVGGGWDEDDDE